MSINFSTKNNIGILEFDQANSKVNLLTAQTLSRLNTLLDEIQGQSLRALLITSAKKDVFIAGADIKEIEKITDSKEGASKAKAGQDILNKIEDLPFPTLAVIDGLALGGGCELALACDYRVATFNEKVKIGLPEVNLGIIPGFGGTYRLPRIVGLQEGLKIILAGGSVDHRKALKIGLVDRLFFQQGLQEQIEKFIETIGKNKTSPRQKPKGLNAFLEQSSLGHWLIFKKSRASVLEKTKGFYPAPLKAIDVIQKTFATQDRREGLKIEAETFAQLAVGKISKNLIQVFYLSEKYRKLTLEGSENLKAERVEKAGIVGAGVMGGGIGQLLTSRNIWVRLKDINYDAIAKGFHAANQIYRKAVQNRRMTLSDSKVKMGRLTGTVDYSGFGNTDLVIEAVVEDMKIKKQVFKDLNQVTKPDTILATNTSALSVTEMAEAAQNPSRVIGIHFFNPVHRMPLVEIITTPQTSQQTIVTTLEFVKNLGKTPIIVKDSCGFIVNRILLAYMNEAGRILEERESIETIDKIMTDFGMPMGPFTLCDEVGLDVGFKVLKILHDHFGERFEPSPIFEKIYKQGNLGKKSGKGFYLHGQKGIVNPEVALLVPVHKTHYKQNECLERMLYIMINEASRCLEEKIVTDPSAIDVGMIFGTGFPAFKGGLLRWADTIGLDHIVSQLEKFKTETRSDRFQPSSYLLQLKIEGKTFF